MIFNLLPENTITLLVEKYSIGRSQENIDLARGSIVEEPKMEGRRCGYHYSFCK